MLLFEICTGALQAIIKKLKTINAPNSTSNIRNFSPFTHADLHVSITSFGQPVFVRCAEYRSAQTVDIDDVYFDICDTDVGSRDDENFGLN